MWITVRNERLQDTIFDELHVPASPNLVPVCWLFVCHLTGVLKKNNTLVDLSLDLNAIGDRGATST